MRDSRYDEIFLYFKEEGHKYNDTLGNSYKSVTTLIHDYVTPFDKTFWLRKKAKELGITPKQLEERWNNITKEACERGTATHNSLEDAIKDVSMFQKAIQYLKHTDDGRVITIADMPYVKAKPLDIKEFIDATENKYEEVYRVFNFYINKGYTIYSEIGAFLIDYLISGTIDLFLIREQDFVILDWKTNRNGLQFESGYFKKDKTCTPHQLTNEWVRKSEMMLPPIHNLENCNGNHYTLQLSLYALMAEIILDIPCVGLGLCHIGSPFIKNKYGMPLMAPDHSYPIDPNGVETVKWYPITYRKDEVKAILADRYMKVKAEKQQQNNQLNLFEQ